MRIRSWQVALSVVCMVLGLLLTIQLRTQLTLRVALPTHQASDLALMLREQEKARAALEQEIAQVKKERQNVNTQAELAKLKNLLGLTEVEGPGVEITLRDSKSNSADGQGWDSYVDFTQIATVINELWAAGAEAISVNGQRIVTTTGVTSSDGHILVNDRKISSPYVFYAIGDSVTLANALRMRGGAFDQIKVYGLGGNLTEESNLKIPAYDKSLQYSYLIPSDLSDRR
jgi:uncharacterized protein YlxW (UPF0749 family)